MCHTHTHTHTHTVCYYQDDLGQSYIGHQSITESSHPCLPWDSVGGVALSPRNFPELEGAENFCRNPGQLGGRPWCYTNTTGDWGYCNISLCVAVGECVAVWEVIAGQFVVSVASL